MKAKQKVTKIELSVFSKAEKHFSSDRDSYRKQLDTYIDVIEDIIDMDLNL